MLDQYHSFRLYINNPSQKEKKSKSKMSMHFELSTAKFHFEILRGYFKIFFWICYYMVCTGYNGPRL